RYRYDSSQYMCCSMSMPVEAGTPEASPENPLLGVIIALDTRVMTELVIEMDSAAGAVRKSRGGPLPQGFALARWDEAFTEALLRLLQLGDSPADTAVLGDGRLRELYYAVLKGEAGETARRAFGVGNEIARSIELLSSRLNEPVTIEDLAAQVGMSRAVFHRKFKQATTMSPIQFVKSMRLNSAAMKMAGGMTVNEAAMDVGYVSSSQFSREFKRMYGQSPGQWRRFRQIPAGLA
uniref:AraC family transcriptional regulator n=1 Tax=Pontiella sp. TaxID=2837462 RepID=UPI0035672989